MYRGDFQFLRESMSATWFIRTIFSSSLMTHQKDVQTQNFLEVSEIECAISSFGSVFFRGWGNAVWIAGDVDFPHSHQRWGIQNWVEAQWFIGSMVKAKAQQLATVITKFQARKKLNYSLFFLSDRYMWLDTSKYIWICMCIYIY